MIKHKEYICSVVIACCLCGCVAEKESKKYPDLNLKTDSLGVQEFFSNLCDFQYDTTFNMLTISGLFPNNWASTREDISFLKSKLGSSKKCACYVSAMSSNLPLNDYAEEGGYAYLILGRLTKEKSQIFGLYACPKISDSARFN